MAKFQIRIISLSAQLVPQVKALRLIANLSLQDAKRLLDYLRDHAPCVLVAGIDREVADYAASLLREAEMDATVEESSIDVPMLLFPSANQQYRWNWLSGPTQV